MRVGYLGPPGTFSEAALRSSALSDGEHVALPTIREVVLAVAGGGVHYAVVPFENSLEGSVNEAVDALVHDAPEVRIVGETLLPVRYALIAREGVEAASAKVVLSHPQSLAQCARFLRESLPGAETRAATSTAEAVRVAIAAEEPTCALGTKLAAELYGGVVLEDGVEDDHSNMTRFVLLARSGTQPPAAEAEAWKSSVLFAGEGDGTPGWLLRCLAEFAERGVNLSRIESRPAKRRLGHYVFLVDVGGRADEPGEAAEAIGALRQHCEEVRLLGAYPAASG
jgi:prephenate dehydratase